MYMYENAPKTIPKKTTNGRVFIVCIEEKNEIGNKGKTSYMRFHYIDH